MLSICFLWCLITGCGITKKQTPCRSCIDEENLNKKKKKKKKFLNRIYRRYTYLIFLTKHVKGNHELINAKSAYYKNKP